MPNRSAYTGIKEPIVRKRSVYFSQCTITRIDKSLFRAPALEVLVSKKEGNGEKMGEKEKQRWRNRDGETEISCYYTFQWLRLIWETFLLRWKDEKWSNRNTDDWMTDEGLLKGTPIMYAAWWHRITYKYTAHTHAQDMKANCLHQSGSK